jgi:soluble lytic murein transglycosylase-like protein
VATRHIVTTYVRRSDTIRTVVAVGCALALAAVLGTLGWWAVRPYVSAGLPLAVGVTTYTEGRAYPTPSFTTRPRPSTPPAAARTSRAWVRPPHRPPRWQLPPPPRLWRALATDPGCLRHTGLDAPVGQVKAALVWAGAREYWRGTYPPAELVGPLPTLTVPAQVMEAVAWQESEWESTVVSCDRGVGAMQIMPSAATWMNRRFATSYDVSTLGGNAALGAQYLQWLMLYFGLYYFGSIDLGTTAPVGPRHAGLTLLDVVLSAYEVGPGLLEHDNGTPAIDSDDWLAIPDRTYVDGVTALMARCVCLTY